jgi:hypothetical protein
MGPRCGLRLDEALIYRGTFGTGVFQCLYQPAPAHWAMLPSTLEWHLAAGLLALAAVFWPPADIGVAVMLLLALLVAGLQAAQVRLAPAYEGFRGRLLIMALCYVQPLVRSWQRYRTRLFTYRSPTLDPAAREAGGPRLPLSGTRTVAFWSEEGRERTELLAKVVAYLNEHRWGKVLDSGWSDWDVAIYCHPWTVVEVCTAQEDHADGKRLLRVRYRLRPSGYTKLLGFLGGAAAVLAVAVQDWPTGVAAGMLLVGCLVIWWRGACRSVQAVAVVNAVATGLGLLRCDTTPGWNGQPAAPADSGEAGHAVA